MTINKDKAVRFDYIDSLRGLAALSVVMFHTALIPNPNLQLPYWASSFILHGDTGVTLFFIISAFTLANSMKQREYESNNVLRFYLRRVFRIVPLFYFWIVISLIRDAIYLQLTHPIQDIFLSLVFGFNFIPGKSGGFVWASWTLGVEMIFYAIFPIVYKYINTLGKSIGFLSFTIIVSAFWTQNFTHYVTLPDAVSAEYLQLSLLYRFPCFAFGIVLFYIFEKINKNKIYSPSISFSLIGIAALGYFIMLSGKLSFLGMDDLYWEAAVCSIFVLGLVTSHISLIVNRITRFLGDISYSLYLNHPTIVFFLIPLFRFFYTLSAPYTIKYLLCFLTVAIILTIISFITYSLVEKPGMRLGRSIIKSKKLIPILTNFRLIKTLPK